MKLTDKALTNLIGAAAGHFVSHSACPDGAALMGYQDGTGGLFLRRHVESCPSCRALIGYLGQMGDWDATPLAAHPGKLPPFLRSSIAFLSTPGSDCLPLTVLHAVGWVPARLTGGVSRKHLAAVFRGSGDIPKKPVPLVAGDLVIVARDRKGKRMPRIKGTLIGPIGRSMRSAQPLRRTLRSDGRGVFKATDLPVGRYLLKAARCVVEIEVQQRPRTALP